MNKYTNFEGIWFESIWFIFYLYREAEVVRTAVKREAFEARPSKIQRMIVFEVIYRIYKMRQRMSHEEVIRVPSIQDAL